MITAINIKFLVIVHTYSFHWLAQTAVQLELKLKNPLSFVINPNPWVFLFTS